MYIMNLLQYYRECYSFTVCSLLGCRSTKFCRWMLCFCRICSLHLYCRSRNNQSPLIGLRYRPLWATGNRNLCAHFCSSCARLRVLSDSAVTAFHFEASLCACRAKISCQRQHIAVNIDTKPLSGILQSHYSSVNGHSLYCNVSHNMRRISAGDLVVNYLKYTFFWRVSLENIFCKRN
jgi:hypothetical protein